MTESYGDPITAGFWAHASRRELVVQCCSACQHAQLYPRPFCLVCSSDDVALVPASGFGTIYSLTTVRIPVLPEFPPPYVVVLVDLDEGPRLLGHLVDGAALIGDRVGLTWLDRPDAPPLPAFTPTETG